MDHVSKECERIRQCQFSSYESISAYLGEANPNHNELQITMDDDVKVQESFIEYDATALFADIGGTMGTCLGWSFLLFFERVFGNGLLLYYALLARGQKTISA